MSKQVLQSGVIYQANELVPIHRSNDEYSDGAMVVPDGENWVKVKTHDGVRAFNYLDFRDDLKLAIDNDGSKIYIHEYYSDYIRGRDENGDTRYFTSEQAARANDFDFSIRLGRWHDKKCSEFYGSETILGYHDRRAQLDGDAKKFVPTYINDSDEYLFGVEVEKVDSNFQRDKNAFELLTTTGWRKEQDGSLNDGGFELVSPILPLNDITRIERACSPVLSYINAKSDTSCGGHFNVSKRNPNTTTGFESSENLLKGMKGFSALLYALYETRLNNRYCRARNWNHYLVNPDKYSAFYKKNNHIVEIRLFSRITNYKVMLWRVKLLQTLLQDFGRNLNQFVLKMSAPENALYQLLREQYTHARIAEKIQLVDKYAEMYKCGTISNSVRSKVNQRFGFEVLPLK